MGKYDDNEESHKDYRAFLNAELEKIDEAEQKELMWDCEFQEAFVDEVRKSYPEIALIVEERARIVADKLVS